MNVSPLKSAFAKYRSVFATTVAFSFFINCLLFVGPLYMLQVYDRVLTSRSEGTLLMLSLIAVCLLFVYGLMEYVRSRMLVRAGLQFDEVLSTPLFKRVVKARLATQSNNAQLGLTDIDRIREFVTGQGLIAFFDAPWVPIFLGMCFLFHFWLGVVAGGGALIILVLAIVNDRMTRTLLQDANTASSAANHFASTTLQNVEAIRALGMERQLGDRWVARHDEMIIGQAKASDRAGAVMSASKFVRMALQAAILGVGALLAMRQEITPGIMIASSIMMGRALTPVEQVVGQWKQFVAARQSYGRLANLFDSIPDDIDRTELPDPRGQIVVEQLTSVAPDTRKPILKGIQFSAAPGSCVAIIGPSGSGKSTLLRHLVGVSNAASGKVRLDGAELSHWDPDTLGTHLGYLPQDVKLFSGTIAENISRFKSRGSEAVIKAAVAAGVHEMVQLLPDGYETQIGDSGQHLSGGQRQRIGLARALYGKPKLIVLDEPNSNLDSEGEEALMRAIRQMKADRVTLIFTTHKTNLLAMSDHVVILKDGTMQTFAPTAEIIKPQPTDIAPNHSGNPNAPVNLKARV